MDIELKERFLAVWEKYFDGTELPIVFYYANEASEVELVKPPHGHRCIMADLSKVRMGSSICFDTDSFGCFGGKRYLGFGQEVMPNFEYFLSCGIPGKLEGERYKKTPELVKEIIKKVPDFEAPKKLIVFKRWDKLQEPDEPDVVIFFADPDVLSGLFTLANFDVGDLNGVFSPFSAGCGSIVQYPYLEKGSDFPRAVLGMFDVSARPFVPGGVLSFSVPMNKFITMVENMDESFLITPSWHKIQKRLKETRKE
ncbi:MAG TPA: DUF169 domain-containing protein [Sedimentisphaerales bacterium]|nr:DUF169 domain-containing protein [Sedimentisphaerales bacterium]